MWVGVLAHRPTESLLRCAVRNLHDARHVDVLARRAPPLAGLRARASTSHSVCLLLLAVCRMRARARACDTRSGVRVFTNALFPGLRARHVGTRTLGRSSSLTQPSGPAGTRTQRTHARGEDRGRFGIAPLLFHTTTLRTPRTHATIVN